LYAWRRPARPAASIALSEAQGALRAELGDSLGAGEAGFAFNAAVGVCLSRSVDGCRAAASSGAAREL